MINPVREIKRRIRRVCGSVTRVQTELPLVALTFDDGPDPLVTPRLLDLLDRHRAHGTFFTVGKSVAEQQALIRRMADAGHAIGSHSWDHSAFPLITGRERRAQLMACERSLGDCGSRLFRPPYGELTLAAKMDAWRLGYEVIGWSVSSEDWYESDASAIADVLVERIRPGDIVLLHDTIYDRGKPHRGPVPDRDSWIDRQAMLGALEMMFGRIGSRFEFVTVPELMRSGLPYRSCWFKQMAPSPGLGMVERLLQKWG